MRLQRPRKSGDALAIAVLAGFGLVLVLIMFLPTPHGRFNWGFGPQWDCGNHGSLDMVCQRKP